MNPRYLQTFARHRALFLAPLVLAMLVAAWFVVGTPKSYESTTSLWFDNSHPSDLTVGASDAALLPPAAEGQALLSELLTTRTFRLKVGRNGPLATYLAKHTSQGFSPTALLGSLKGTPSLDKRITDALGKGHVTSLVAGPQILAVTVKAPDPKVAAGTLRALVDEYRAERGGVSAARARASVAYYKAQVNAASKAADKARGDLGDYRLGNPTATTISDSNLRELSRVERAAVSRLLAVTNDLNQATINLAAPLASNSAFRVIDRPRVPDGPVSGRKVLVLAIFAGLFAGTLVSILGVVALTAVERTREDERRNAPQPATGAAAATPADAFRGTIVGVRDDGTTRTARPVWTIHEPAGEQPRLGLGSPVLQADEPSRRGVVGEVTETADGGRIIELEITRKKLGVRGGTGILAVRPTDTRWVGIEVAFSQAPEAQQGFEEPLQSHAPDNADPHGGNGRRGSGEPNGSNGGHGTHGMHEETRPIAERGFDA